ncbi:processing protease [Deferribacter desulfuricans SSM1]|uniref:Processing protease n=1 Tax=Deferribacter desulfuricans (strain DSM 14783 / JCM 11476 / NBRC 101012 / SSM1) TaxID=639282 RepID=D3PAQ8_DEFDS|nr:pitrilysin family protein [Deferribacter desulfuricans]BAI79681.1 processing protease [Deferribacter desulfuricans SSM1]
MLKRARFIIILLLFSSAVYAGGSKVILDNGIKFIENKRDYNPTFSLVIMIKGGLFLENDKNSGIGNIALSTWVKSSELLKYVEEKGGSLHASNGSDFAEISLSIPSKYIDSVLPLLEKLFFERKIDDKIFDNEKRITLMRIKTILDRPDEYAIKNFMKTTYNGFPYSRDVSGDYDTVDKLTIDDIKSYLNKLISGKNMIVSIAGSFEKEQSEKLKTFFEKLNEGHEIKIDCNGSEIVDTKKVELPHKNIKQAKLFLGFDAPPANSNDYIKVKLLADVLGGGMSSVFFNILRKEKGYAYSVGSFYPSKLCNSRFVNYIGMNYENVDDAVATFLSVGKNPEKYISKEDVSKAKNYLMGRILMEAQTNYKRAWYAAFFELLGLGYDFFDSYIDNLENITLEDIIIVAKKYINDKYTLFILKPTN